MKAFLSKWTPRILPVVFFAVAVFILNRELKHFTLQTLADQLDDFSADQIALALGLTFLCYFALTAYDALALNYINHKLSFPRIWISSFLGYSFSNNLGWPIITGTSMRYRFYSHWRISALNAAKVVAFTNVTFWTGICFIGAFIFLYEPITLSGIQFLEGTTTRPLGWISLILVILFLTFVLKRKKPIPFFAWSIPMPSFRMALGQIAASSVDWILIATVFYVLLPQGHSLDFIKVLQIFILAQIVGLISHVPGGLGIFEALIVQFLSPEISKPELLGTLLVFRFCYYLLPLMIGLLILGYFELFGNKSHRPRHSKHKGHHKTEEIEDV